MAIAGFATETYIEVPLRIDDALDMTGEEYEKYLENLDQSLLKFKPGKHPVLFKMRKILPYHLYLKIENMKMEMVKKKEGDKVTNEMMPKMAWICEEVRFALVDIINPPGTADEDFIEFKRDSDGLCSPDIMGRLMSLGVHMDLWSARQGASKKSETKIDKKK